MSERAWHGMHMGMGMVYGYTYPNPNQITLEIYEIFSPMISGGGGCGCTGLDASEASI
jgi:hypothetical protein